MPWRVDVAPGARQAIAEFDAVLREESIERVAELADEPMAFLRRTQAGEPRGLWAFEYESEALEGLRVVLIFDAIDPGRKTLGLAVIMRTTTDPQ